MASSTTPARGWVARAARYATAVANAGGNPTTFGRIAAAIPANGRSTNFAAITKALALQSITPQQGAALWLHTQRYSAGA